MFITGATFLLYNYRGDNEYRVLRIVSVRNVQDERLRPDTTMYNQITRGQYLVTAEDVRRGGIRSYYISRAESFQQIGMLGLLYHRALVMMGVRAERE